MKSYLTLLDFIQHRPREMLDLRGLLVFLFGFPLFDNGHILLNLVWRNRS